MQGRIFNLLRAGVKFRVGQQSMWRFLGTSNKENSKTPIQLDEPVKRKSPETECVIQSDVLQVEEIKTQPLEFKPLCSASYELHAEPAPFSSDKYHPIYDATFRHGEEIPFSFFVKALEEVSNAKGKNSKNLQKEVLSNLFRSIIVLRPDHLSKCFYLCVGRLAAEHKGIELGIGNETLYKAVAKAVGMSEKQIKSQENVTGDLGIVAASGKASQKNITTFFVKKVKTQPHTVGRVYDTFWKIANTHGANSANLKEGELIRLLNNADSDEAKYIIRMAQKALKIGASELTMQSALARAVAMTPPNQSSFPPSILKYHDYETKAVEIEEVLKKAINECPDYDKVIPAMLQIGPNGYDMAHFGQLCKITPGIPVKPMLAQPTKGIQEILARFTDINFTCEYKYDGMRAQIHILPDRSIKFYSRNAENLTPMYPDLEAFLQSHINFDKISDCILDSEIVAFDRETHRIKPFQDIQTRGRKNVDINSIKVEVCIFPFDLLYLNGTSYLDLTLDKRRQALVDNFELFPGKFQFVEYKDTTNFEDIEQMLYDSVKVGCEGLMIKTLDQHAEYKPAKRSFNWLKLKKDYLEDSKLGDSVDLVPIGAFWGTVRYT
jgi:DNA ligase-1